MGLLVDNLDAAEYNASFLTVAQVSGAGASSATVDTSGAHYMNRVPDWVFFDIAGGAEGDSFVIRGGGGVNGTATLGGVVFDSVMASLGTGLLLEAGHSGSDSVLLGIQPAIGFWTNTANAPWLHLDGGSASGRGSATIGFYTDENPDASPRIGTLTLAGQTVTVRQAGASYAPLAPVFSLPFPTLTKAQGIAVDTEGNVYVADTANSRVLKWSPADNSVSVLISEGLNHPNGVAVDRYGNVYIADTGNSQLRVWTPGGAGGILLRQPDLVAPYGVAVDDDLNVYITDRSAKKLLKWVKQEARLTTLIQSGLDDPTGVAVDVAGNLYIADTSANVVRKWTASNQTLSDLASGLNNPIGVAADGSGNVYIADLGSKEIKRWSGLSGVFSPSPSIKLSGPVGVAVRKTGDLYVLDSGSGRVVERVQALVADLPSPIVIVGSGPGELPPVLSSSLNLVAPFSPVSDQPWLHVTGVAKGVVIFSCDANLTGTPRDGHLYVLGKQFTVTQIGPSLPTTSRWEGPDAGVDSVLLNADAALGTWTAQTMESWLHVNADSTSGLGTATVGFSFDANPGPTRSGTLFVAGLAFTVNQAGASYVPVNLVTPLIYSTNFNLPALTAPNGVATDNSGNVYVADSGANAIKKWTAADNTLTTVVSDGLNGPEGVAVDDDGNLFIADTGNSALKKWDVADHTLTNLVSSGLYRPEAVAVDASGNVYLAEPAAGAVVKWSASDGSLTNLLPNDVVLNTPYGVAVDRTGAIYVADTYHDRILKVSGDRVTTVVNIYRPYGLSVDDSGNVYFSSLQNFALRKWTAADKTVTEVPHADHASYATVDRLGNLYWVENNGVANKVSEIVRAFVDPTHLTMRSEAPTTGSLRPVLPPEVNLLPPFAPTSDSDWLTITGTSGGVVNLETSATKGYRTTSVHLLGQTIPVNQAPPMLLNITPYRPGSPVELSFLPTGITTPFELLTTTNLALPIDQWTSLVTGSIGQVGVVVFDEEYNAKEGQRYYHLRSP